jgi:multimeric flavodoxin WrbA
MPRLFESTAVGRRVAEGGASVKVVAVSGSARKDGNTKALLGAVLEPLSEAGHDCRLIELAGKDIRGCTACGVCRTKLDERCHGRNDFGNEVIAEVFSADAIVLGSPTYFADVSAEMKALIDRAGYVGRSHPHLLARKPGASVVAVRRGGAIHAFDTMNHFFLIAEMVVVGSSYWNIGVGREKGDVADDAEGMGTMRRLGENMLWVMERLARP